MERIEKTIKCPFFRGVYRKFIYCDPTGEGMAGTAASFETMAQRNEYISNFCGTHCWKGCVTAQLCLQKFEEENNE